MMRRAFAGNIFAFTLQPDAILNVGKDTNVQHVLDALKDEMAGKAVIHHIVFLRVLEQN